MRFLDLFKALEEFIIMLKMPEHIYEYSDSDSDSDSDDEEETNHEPYEPAEDDIQNE